MVFDSRHRPWVYFLEIVSEHPAQHRHLHVEPITGLSDHPSTFGIQYLGANFHITADRQAVHKNGVGGGAIKMAEFGHPVAQRRIIGRCGFTDRARVAWFQAATQGGRRE